MNGTSVPIQYSVLDGALVGILSDPSTKSLDLAVNPQANGGALEVNVPRHVIDLQKWCRTGCAIHCQG